jgi:hypothetical protein
MTGKRFSSFQTDQERITSVIAYISQKFLFLFFVRLAQPKTGGFFKSYLEKKPKRRFRHFSPCPFSDDEFDCAAPSGEPISLSLKTSNGVDRSLDLQLNGSGF